MRIVEAIDQMSASYLERIVRSFTKEYPKKDEAGYRDEIQNNIDVLSSLNSISDRFLDCFQNSGQPHSEKILAELIITSLLYFDGNTATEEAIYDYVANAENAIIERGKQSDSLKHLSENSIMVYKAVAEVALEDDSISQDEMRLIQRLANKLGINAKDELLILSSLNHFPKKGNETHSLTEVRQTLNDLQKSGLVFFCNQPEGKKEKFFVLPSEIIPPIKDLLDVELLDDKYNSLLQKLSVDQLRRILKYYNQQSSGTKEVISDRIINSGIRPSESLRQLSIDELRDLAGSLPGMKKSGVKDEKIKEVI